MKKEWAVINTRPLEHCHDFEQMLGSQIDAKIFSLPTSRCEVLFDDSLNVGADLVLFTSPLAVRFGMPLLSHLYDCTCFGGIGSETLKAIQTFDVSRVLECDLIKTSSKIWWNWFKVLGLDFHQVLILQGEDADDYLFRAFRSDGFDVSRIFLYRHVFLPCPARLIQDVLGFDERCVWIFMSVRAVEAVEKWIGFYGLQEYFLDGMALCMSERIAKEAKFLFGERIEIMERTSALSVVEYLVSIVR